MSKGKGRKKRASKVTNLRDRKRQEFEQEASNSPQRKWFLAAVVGLALLALFGFAIGRSGNSATPERSAVSAPQDYAKGNIEMTEVKAAIGKGEVSVPLAQVKAKKLLYFDYSVGGKKVPLMAMVTPSGKLFTGSSMCEPCRSNKFHIEPDRTLTCNACGTKWDLETLKGISGGCPNYPPQEMKSQVRGGKVILQEKDIQGWQPRTV